jgi:hypothetical protein
MNGLLRKHLSFLWKTRSAEKWRKSLWLEMEPTGWTPAKNLMGKPFFQGIFGQKKGRRRK